MQLKLIQRKEAVKLIGEQNVAKIDSMRELDYVYETVNNHRIVYSIAISCYGSKFGKLTRFISLPIQGVKGSQLEGYKVELYEKTT